MSIRNIELSNSLSESKEAQSSAEAVVSQLNFENQQLNNEKRELQEKNSEIQKELDQKKELE